METVKHIYGHLIMMNFIHLDGQKKIMISNIVNKMELQLVVEINLEYILIIHYYMAIHRSVKHLITHHYQVKEILILKLLKFGD